MIDPPFDIGPKDALSQPTRARLFALLGELGRPAGTAELAERFGLHPNGVRLAGWAHAIGVVALLAFIAIGFVAATPGEIANGPHVNQDSRS